MATHADQAAVLESVPVRVLRSPYEPAYRIAQRVQAVRSRRITRPRHNRVLPRKPYPRGGRPYACTKCSGELFVKSTSYAAHMLGHYKRDRFLEMYCKREGGQERPQECKEKETVHLCPYEDCGRVCRLSAAGYEGPRKPNPKHGPYHCPRCSDVFIRSTDLATHMRAHYRMEGGTPEVYKRKKPAYRCPHEGCTRVCRSTEKFAAHVRTHKDEVRNGDAMQTRQNDGPTIRSRTPNGVEMSRAPYGIEMSREQLVTLGKRPTENRPLVIPTILMSRKESVRENQPSFNNWLMRTQTEGQTSSGSQTHPTRQLNNLHLRIVDSPYGPVIAPWEHNESVTKSMFSSVLDLVRKDEASKGKAVWDPNPRAFATLLPQTVPKREVLETSEDNTYPPGFGMSRGETIVKEGLNTPAPPSSSGNLIGDGRQCVVAMAPADIIVKKENE